jgi:hypothetical protein
MATTQEQVGKAVVPIGVALVVLFVVALALSMWGVAACH